MQRLGCGDTLPTLSCAYTRIVVHLGIHSVPPLAPCGAGVVWILGFVTLHMHIKYQQLLRRNFLVDLVALVS